jgi:hypothetical protein
MGNGVKGAGSGQSPTPVSTPSVEEPKKTGSPDQTVTTENKETQKSPEPSGRTAEGLANDPAVALRKATLSKSAGLKKPTKAQLNEIRDAIKDGKKEEAIKLTIKYYNIDTSGAQEVKYVGPKKDQAAAGAENKDFKQI